jgi:hypothetical protein
LARPFFEFFQTEFAFDSPAVFSRAPAMPPTTPPAFPKPSFFKNVLPAACLGLGVVFLPAEETKPAPAAPVPAPASAEVAPEANAPKTEPEEKLRSALGAGGYIGLKNEKGEWVIQPKYNDIAPFSEGLARIRLNDKWAFIDRTGKEVLTFERKDGFWGVMPFSEGRAAITLKNLRKGFIDKTGKIVIPAIYSDARSFQEGLAAVALNHRDYGFIDKDGKVVIPLNYAHAWPFSEGLAGVQEKGMKDAGAFGGKWGFMDKSGKFVIPPKYDSVGPFSEGLACVTKSREMSDEELLKELEKWSPRKHRKRLSALSRSSLAYGADYDTDSDFRRKCGYIDKTGKEVIPLIYGHYIGNDSDFKDGKVRVRQGSNFFYIDKQGNKVDPPERKRHH